MPSSIKEPPVTWISPADAVIVPTTTSFVCGVVVPMPTLLVEKSPIDQGSARTICNVKFVGACLVIARLIAQEYTAGACCAITCHVTNRGVIVARGVGIERIRSIGGVIATRGIVSKRLVSIGGVIVARGVGIERPASIGGVKAARGVETERIPSTGDVIGACGV